MKKLVALTLVVGMTMLARAGSFVVHVRMPDQSVVTFEWASVPRPDSDGLYHFHIKGRTNLLVVHASNVWIEEKAKK